MQQADTRTFGRKLSKLGGELCIIDGAFAAYLRGHSYARLTIGWYQSRLRRAARFLADRRQSLESVSADDVLILSRQLAHRHHHALKMYRAALRAWLSFGGRDIRRSAVLISNPWQDCLDAYGRFLLDDRGLAPTTRLYRRRYARCFLAWRFRRSKPDWAQVVPQDIWRFAERFGRPLKPGSANVMLYSLGCFFRFLHLRGLCGPHLACAVPHFANYGQTRHPDVLSEQQRDRLLAAFPSDARGLRDRAIALCLLDLGLRAKEVIDLKVTDLDWSQSLLVVPAVKSNEGRRLPMPPRVANALRAYIDNGRAGLTGNRLFLRHRSLVGKPFSLSGLRQTIRRAFRRCNFPKHWTGTHRLRHTFATRLYVSGADPKQIADLLGHRDLQSTDTYVQSDQAGLRALARPWPI